MHAATSIPVTARGGPNSLLRWRLRLDAVAGIQINMKKTENNSRKRLIDITNAEINKLTPER